MITVVHLYDDNMSEHYIGYYDRELSPDEKREIARAYNALEENEEGAHEEDSRTMSFRVLEPLTAENSDLKNVWNYQ